jgi:hypothetical protein
MTENQALNSALEDTLQCLRARQRQRAALFLAGRGLFYGCVAAFLLCGAAVVARADWSRVVLWWSPVILPLGMALGGLVGLTRRVDDLHVARALDRAAAGDDRFASAVQLRGHRRAERARLVLADALARVARTPARAALPLRAARELKWLPVPAVALALLLWLAPGTRQAVQAAPEAEVAPDEWQALSQHLDEELKELPEPRTPEEQQLRAELEKLAEFFKQQPDKKEALAELARLRAALEKLADESGVPDVSMRQAAQALRASAALARFAMLLKAGDYAAASAELEALAEKLKENEQALSAEDFEAAAADLENLSKELAGGTELNEACRQAATAAGRMNRDELARALKHLSKTLDRNAKSLRRCDGMCRSRSLLDDLARKLAQCKGGKCGTCARCGQRQCNGNCSAFVKQNDKKGGLKAGWGTAAKWNGGRLGGDAEQRLPTLADAAEGGGEFSVTPTLSPDERAQSAQDQRELYVNMVRKAEADLALETVPPALRDYLRRYFVAIQPAGDDRGSE